MWTDNELVDIRIEEAKRSFRFLLWWHYFGIRNFFRRYPMVR